MAKAGNELRFSLGDIVISLNPASINSCRLYNNSYRRFVTKEKADINLKIIERLYDNQIQEEAFFDVSGTWSISKQGDLRILRTTSATAVFDKVFTSGSIYLDDRDSNDGYNFPLEYPLGEILMINLLSKGKGIILHSCGVSYKNKGFLFVGSSGAGKSTIAKLWKDKEGVDILNDDRIIVRKDKQGFWMYGTPWYGDVKACSSGKVPLEKIFFLRHAAENSLKALKEIEAVSRLFVCSFPPFWDKQGTDFTLDFCGCLAGAVSCHDFGFLPDQSSLDFIDSCP
ncbi:MAG: hypothetical protein JW734_01410 [Candidatus Omnitrophica bacterium]|nr:hypothetical protein [Candidatus Omnitrophota bacterium]